MEIHKYQVSPSQVTHEESASQVTAPGHGPFLNTESKTKRRKKTYKLFDDSLQESWRPCRVVSILYTAKPAERHKKLTV